MKMLIVDNEQHVIDAIKLLIEWDSFQFEKVLTAMDGEEAMFKIEGFNPDIVLTDMKMPNVNGVQLLNWMQEKNKKAKIIAISGYSDFQYVQHTIRKGGIDYITKPIDGDLLNGSIKKAVDLIEKENAYLSQKKITYESEKIKWEKTLYKALVDPQHYQTDLNHFKEHFYIRENSPITFITTKLDQLSDRIYNQFKDNFSLLYFSIKNVCQEILDEKGIEDYFIFSEEDEGYLNILFWNTVSHVLPSTEKMIHQLNRLYGASFTVGISKEGKFSRDLNIFYEQSKRALYQRNLKKGNDIIVIFDEDKNNVDIPLFEEIRDDVILRIRGAQWDLVHEKLDELYEKMNAKEYISEQMINQFYDSYELQRNKIVKELFGRDLSEIIESLLYNQKDLYKDFHVKKTYGRLLEFVQRKIREDIKNIYEVFLQKISTKDKEMYQVKKYIDNHYMYPITLDLLNKEFHLSNAHLSRSFKNEFGITISDYIRHIRIEKAKILLKNPHLTIKEVSNQVGIEDEKYFSKLFKGEMNVTPNQYRQ